MATKLNSIYKILVLILLGYIAYCQYKQMYFNDELLEATKNIRTHNHHKKEDPYNVDYNDVDYNSDNQY